MGTTAPLQTVSNSVVSNLSWMVSVVGGCPVAAAGRRPDKANMRSDTNPALLFIGSPQLSQHDAPRPVPETGER